MKKELGKWFMDIAKYLLTGVLLASMVSDLQDMKWVVYVCRIHCNSVMSWTGYGYVTGHERRN